MLFNVRSKLNEGDINHCPIVDTLVLSIYANGVPPQ